ncbi:MAG: DUF3526 domain-containing protein [Pseudomonadota bacterium]
MSSTAQRIAREEWRYWRRSRLVLATSVVALLLVITALVATMGRMAAERDQRVTMQKAAEDTFRSQPDRHPHRMVHYGHYVFRTPLPLAAVDPGVDPFAGTVMFLEGHRRNSAVFSPFYSAAQAGQLAALTPARAYQLLAPLVLIIAGYACLTREKAARTDRLLLMAAPGSSTIVHGKALALAQLAGLLLLPLALATVGLTVSGADAVSGLTMLLGYGLYLLVWAAIIVVVSARVRSAAASVLMLLSIWLALCVVMPGAASRAAKALEPVHGKISTDLDMVEAMRDLGDAHDTNDPAFDKLKANLLIEYGVSSVEDLPVNIRGLVAEAGEAEQAEMMDELAEDHMAEELAQANAARRFGWLSPALAVRSLSMVLAGTDLSQQHQFQREAEATRIEFVQALNRLQATAVSYADDVIKSNDTDAERRSRVSADNWQRLREFSVAAPSAGERLTSAAPYAGMLTLWLVVLLLFLRRAGQALGVDHD